MNLRDFKIGARLGIGFGIILLILVAMVLSANFLNYSNKSELTKGLQLSTAKNLQAAAMERHAGNRHARATSAQTDVSLMQKEGQVKDQRKRYETAVEALKALG